jgi:hypothetical protein
MKFGCVIEKAADGTFQVNTSDGTHWWTEASQVWMKYLHPQYFLTGMFPTEPAARAALDACKVAPPGWYTVTGDAVCI